MFKLKIIFILFIIKTFLIFFVCLKICLFIFLNFLFFKFEVNLFFSSKFTIIRLIRIVLNIGWIICYCLY